MSAVGPLITLLRRDNRLGVTSPMGHGRPFYIWSMSSAWGYPGNRKIGSKRKGRGSEQLDRQRWFPRFESISKALALSN